MAASALSMTAPDPNATATMVNGVYTPNQNNLGITAPGYEASYDPSTMALAPEIQKELDGLTVNTQGLDAFRKLALRNGPSTWAQMQDQLQSTQAAGQKDQAASQGASARATAEDSLAMSGGLSSGARERLATKGATNQLAMGQDVDRQENLNKMNVGIQDEQNRVGELSQLPSMENQALQPQIQKQQMWDTAAETDANRAVTENEQRNQYNMNLYQQQMQAQAAQEQANATENSGKK